MKIEKTDDIAEDRTMDCTYREDSWDDYGVKQTLCDANIDYICPYKKEQRSGYGERIYLCTGKN